eukprot:753763-Hanusia_phi.AAC.3
MEVAGAAAFELPNVKALPEPASDLEAELAVLALPKANTLLLVAALAASAGLGAPNEGAVETVEEDEEAPNEKVIGAELLGAGAVAFAGSLPKLKEGALGASAGEGSLFTG